MLFTRNSKVDRLQTRINGQSKSIEMWQQYYHDAINSFQKVCKHPKIFRIYVKSWTVEAKTIYNEECSVCRKRLGSYYPGDKKYKLMKERFEKARDTFINNKDH